MQKAGQPPSRTLGCQLHETWLAWQLDDAVFWFGETIEGRRFRYDNKGRLIEDRLQQLLADPGAPKPTQMTTAQLAAFDTVLGL